MLLLVNPVGSREHLSVDEVLRRIEESDDDYWLSGSGEAEVHSALGHQASVGIKRIPRNVYRIAYSPNASLGMRVLLQNPGNDGLVAVFVGGDYSLEPASLFGLFSSVEACVRRLARGEPLDDVGIWVQWEDLNFERQGEPLTLDQAEQYPMSIAL